MNSSQACQILGITLNQSYKKGYKRYRHLAKKWHPDKNGDTEKFKELQDAWNTLKTILPKIELAILLENQHGYWRWVKDAKDDYHAWIEYKKIGNQFHCLANNAWDVPDEHKVLDAEKVKIVLRAEYNKHFLGHVTPFNYEKSN